MKGVPNMTIRYDKKTNRFRAENGRFVSRKHITYDFNSGKFRYKGKFVKIEGVQFDVKTLQFRSQRGKFVKIKTTGKRPIKGEIVTDITDVTDMFSITQDYIMTPYGTPDIILKIDYDPYLPSTLMRILKSSIYNNKRIYLFASLESSVDTFKISSITADQNANVYDMEYIIDDLISKLYEKIKAFFISNINITSVQIFAVLKQWIL